MASSLATQRLSVIVRCLDKYKRRATYQRSASYLEGLLMNLNLDAVHDVTM